MKIVAFLSAAWQNFRHAHSGNVTVLAGLTFIPAIGLIGLAADYAMALETKAKMNLAADAASLAAITRAQNDIGANQSSQTAIADGVAAANGAFSSNVGPGGAFLSQPISVSLTRSGGTFTAVVTYQAAMPTIFAKIMNINTMNIYGGSTATLTLPSYLDFYLLLDVSGSMGIPSTAAVLVSAEI